MPTCSRAYRSYRCGQYTVGQVGYILYQPPWHGTYPCDTHLPHHTLFVTYPWLLHSRAVPQKSPPRRGGTRSLHIPLRKTWMVQPGVQRHRLGCVLHGSVHLLKLVHDKLPMRKQVGRHRGWIKPECYYCAMPDTLDHLQKSHCNPASIQFRDDIKRSVREYMIKHQCPTKFTQQFLSVLEWWLTSTNTGYSSTTATWISQEAIGWRLLTQGFLTRQWH